MKKAQTPRKTLAPGVARVPKRLHYPLDVMLLCVRWYVAYSLSLRNLEEMMAERETPITIRQVKYLNNVVEVRHEVAYRSCSHFSRYRRSEPPVSPGESRSLSATRGRL